MSSLPSSWSIRTAALTIALVWEAMRKIASVAKCASASLSRYPTASWYTTLPSLRTMAAAPGESGRARRSPRELSVRRPRRSEDMPTDSGVASRELLRRAAGALRAATRMSGSDGGCADSTCVVASRNGKGLTQLEGAWRVAPDADGLKTVFADRFGGAPTHLARAPGRVNLIGEHTDYNDLPVFPDGDPARGPHRLAPPRRRHGGSCIPDAAFPPVELELRPGIPPDGPGHWGNYVKAPADELARRYAIWRGFDGVLALRHPGGGRPLLLLGDRGRRGNGAGAPQRGGCGGARFRRAHGRRRAGTRAPAAVAWTRRSRSRAPGLRGEDQLQPAPHPARAGAGGVALRRRRHRRTRGEVRARPEGVQPSVARSAREAFVTCGSGGRALEPRPHHARQLPRPPQAPRTRVRARAGRGGAEQEPLPPLPPRRLRGAACRGGCRPAPGCRPRPASAR
jgi:hypothetical protein